MSSRMLAKLAVSGLAIFTLTAAVYKSNGMTINFPEGWDAPTTGHDGLIEVHEPDSGANCNIENKALDTVAGLTVAEINSEFGHVFQRADWADFLGLAEDDLTVLATETRPLNDAIFHIATLRVKAGEDVHASVRYGFYIVPGHVIMAGCYVEESLYPMYTQTFEKTISSFRPW